MSSRALRTDHVPAPASYARVVQLFVSPYLSRRAQRRTLALRRALEGEGAEVIVTQGTSAPLAIDPRADRVCAVGGDGTLRHVVDALHRSGRSLRVSAYPVGTINLLARECGYARSPITFARRILGGGAGMRHHTALVGDRPLLTCASVGPDSVAVGLLSPALKRAIGRAAYLVAFGKLLWRWPRTPLTLSCGGERIECEAVYVAKGRFFAGPWSFAPRARLTEPRLHVVTLRRATRRRFLRFAWTMLRGGAVERLDGVGCFTCSSLTIEGPMPAPVQVDGDVEARLPVTISLRPQPTLFA